MRRNSLKRDLSEPDNSGPSLNNFVSNIKGLPAAFSELGRNIKQGTVGKMVYRDMNDMGKSLVNKFKRK